MNITAKLCLLHLLMWHQVNASSVSPVTFKWTPVNLSLLKYIQHKLVTDLGSLIECAVECDLDEACHGFGYKQYPDNSCLLMKTTDQSENYQFALEGFEYFLMEDLPSHCGQVPSDKSGLTLLDIGGGQLIVACCEQKVDGGGWLVLQQRLDGSQNFTRDWEDYRVGFGKPWGEFWIGNDNLHQLTKDGNAELLIQLEDLDGVKFDVKYKTFTVENETMKYRLKINGYEGGNTPGDSFKYTSGNFFSTFDRDNDRWSSNCALRGKGGWWYWECTYTNLNGVYGVNSVAGITWYHWKRYDSLPHVRMLLKKKQGT